MSVFTFRIAAQICGQLSAIHTPFIMGKNVMNKNLNLTCGIILQFNYVQLQSSIFETLVTCLLKPCMRLTRCLVKVFDFASAKLLVPKKCRNSTGPCRPLSVL